MFTYPLGGGVCRGHLQYPIFAPGSSKVAVVFFDLVVCSGSRICPSRACMRLLLVSYSFCVFCCWRRGVSRCKHCSTEKKGPRSQPVSLVLWVTPNTYIFYFKWVFKFVACPSIWKPLRAMFSFFTLRT